MRRWIRVGGVLLGLALGASVLSHAMLDRATPLVGSSVKAAPARVELWFTEPLEPAFSTAKVVDADGRQVDRSDASVDKNDRRHLTVSLPSLPAGRYRVVWRVASADTHATAGDFVFDVSP